MLGQFLLENLEEMFPWYYVDKCSTDVLTFSIHIRFHTLGALETEWLIFIISDTRWLIEYLNLLITSLSTYTGATIGGDRMDISLPSLEGG